jgi:hypothetical protein
MPQCRFGDREALGRFRLPAGCIAFPEDRVQDLCWHHIHRATPLGGMELVEDYTLPGGARLAEVLEGIC